MLLRAALRRNRPCKPIETLTDFKLMLPDKVVAFAEVFQAFARVAQQSQLPGMRATDSPQAVP